MIIGEVRATKSKYYYFMPYLNMRGKSWIRNVRFYGALANWTILVELHNLES